MIFTLRKENRYLFVLALTAVFFSGVQTASAEDMRDGFYAGPLSVVAAAVTVQKESGPKKIRPIQENTEDLLTSVSVQDKLPLAQAETPSARQAVLK